MSVDTEGLVAVENLLDEIDSLSKEIGELEKKVDRLNAARQECISAQRKLSEELTRMDVVQNHHMGWENRTLLFLLKLRRRAKHLD